jgi:hypothetical protein
MGGDAVRRYGAIDQVFVNRNSTKKTAEEARTFWTF